MRRLVLLLRRAVLGGRGLLALLLPVAELVFIVPGLGWVSFLHRRRRLGLRMRPALRSAIVVLIYRALGRTRSLCVPDARFATRGATIGCCGRASGRGN